MKHKRVFYTLTIVLYLVVVLLCLAFLFSIKEVKCNYTSITNSTKYEQVEKQLDKYDGKNLLFVNTSDIVKDLQKDSYIIVKSVKKSFPNKILVEIEERQEIFIVESEFYRYYLDKNYFVLKKVDKQTDIVSSQLILLNLNNYNNFNVEELQVGTRCDIIDGWIENCIGEMISVFSDWKNILDKIHIEGSNKILGYKIFFETKQGLKIEVLDPNIKVDLDNNSFIYDETTNDLAGIEEVREVYKIFTTISDYEKTKGNLLVYRLQDDKITIMYTCKV